MRLRLTLVATAAVGLLASSLLAIQPAHAAGGLHIDSGRIVEANGSNFIMRGVSHPHVWYPTQTSSFANIKALGANTVRVVLGGQRGGNTPVGPLVTLCKQNKLICVLEVHDTTGYGDANGATTLDEAVSYWITQKAALVGQENYVVINIGNEPFGNNQSVSATWPTATTNAIQRLRSNGFQHLIMVDGPMWGQDWGFIMRDNARRVFDSDPQRNTVFSIHMYGVYDTAPEITSYLSSFQTAGLPLVIGEFGDNHSDGNPDEDTIMAQAQSRGLGYIGWSWSGNGGGVEYLDMTRNFDPRQLTSWGQRIFNGANGIRTTSREATIYSGSPPPSSPAPIPSSPAPIPSSPAPIPSSPAPIPSTPAPDPAGCTATYTIVNQWPGGFQGEVRVVAGNAAIKGWTVTWTLSSGQSITQTWNASLVTSGSAVTARNVAHNGQLGAGANTSFGFIGGWSGSNAAPAVKCTAS